MKWKTYIFSNIYVYQKCSHTEHFLQYVSVMLLRMFWMEYIVAMLAELSKNRIFICCEIFMCKYCNTFVNFERILFPAALVGCFLRMLNIQARNLKKISIRRDIVHPGMNYLYSKYCLGYAGILPDRDGMKNAPASYKRNNKLMKKWLHLSDLLLWCSVLALM